MLIESEDWGEAHSALQELSRHYPRRLEVLELQIAVCAELEDSEGLQQAAAQLIVLTPDDPDISFALAMAYLTNMRPALALRHWRRFVEKWPDHELAEEARKMIVEVEPEARQMWANMGFPPDEAEELAVLHEQVNSVMGGGQYKEARRLADNLTQRAPYFTSGWNNLSQLQWLEGEREEAITSARRALEIDPQNIHALANLVHFQLLSGSENEAQQTAQTLRTAEAQNGELMLKKAEAFAYLGDDEAILEIFETAEREDELPQRGDEPLLYHLAAVAHARRGNESEAKRLWFVALEIFPDYESAWENLEDYNNDIGECHAPWPFPFQNWIEEKVIRDLQDTMTKHRRAEDKVLERILRKWLVSHGDVEHLTPHLLDRGDGPAREFALLLISTAHTTFLLEAARDFALGQRGPDALRHRAAQIAFNAGLLENPVRLWWQGEWKEVQLLDFEIHEEPTPGVNKKIIKLLERAQLAMSVGYGEGAEEMYREALEIDPNAPYLKNNLAASLLSQKREEEALALLEEIIAQDPDYLFARVSLARIALRDNKGEEARALLEPILKKRRFHVTELRTWAQIQIDLSLFEKQPDAARMWLHFWENTLPDDPLLEHFREKIETL